MPGGKQRHATPMMAVAVITYVELEKAIRIALRSRLEAVARTRRTMASGHFSRTDAARKHERRRDGEKLERVTHHCPGPNKGGTQGEERRPGRRMNQSSSKAKCHCGRDSRWESGRRQRHINLLRSRWKPDQPRRERACRFSSIKRLRAPG